MSAIAAIYNLDLKPVKPSRLVQVLAQLVHRGDDAQGLWTEKYVGMGHRMRWVAPESFIEKLPLKRPDNSLVITCDARIDNRVDLISRLRLDNKAEHQITDSEIILSAYEKWGEDSPRELIGDFVFAIWDDREQKLFCARDPLGVKHFYYHYDPGRSFMLASEIKAVLKFDGVPCELDEEHLADYLIVNSTDREGTFYRGIKRLPATHALSVTRSGIRVFQYWKPRPDEIRLRKPAEYHEAFREKFVEAVTCRLRSAYPVGSMLSGGLDTSSIVCVADEYLKGADRPPLHTFSAIFPSIAKIDPRIDESKYIRSVLERSDCVEHFITADDESPFHEIDEVQRSTDHPVGMPIYMDWQLYKAASKSGVKVVLSGIDGDSTVSHGYEDFSEFARRGWYLRLLREAFALNRNMPRRNHKVKISVWNRGIANVVPLSVVRLVRAVRGRGAKPARPSTHFPLHANSITPVFKAANDLENKIKNTADTFHSDGLSAPELHWQGLTSGHFALILEHSEKAAAAFGVEPRFPFFDRRLIEFCIALPPGQRIYRGWTRSIFRHAMSGILPEDVRWRTDKSNIGASVKVNMQKYGAAKLNDVMYADSDVLAKYIDIEFVRSAYDDYKRDPMRRDQEALFLLTTVYLSNWLKISGFGGSFERREAA